MKQTNVPYVYSTLFICLFLSFARIICSSFIRTINHLHILNSLSWLSGPKLLQALKFYDVTFGTALYQWLEHHSTCQ